MLTIPFHATLGENIKTAIERAVKTARNEQQTVQFDFNGVTVTVDPLTTSEAAYAQWDYEMNRSTREFIASPRYAEQQRERAVELTHRQTRMNALIEHRAPAFLTLPGTLAWIAEFVPLADWTGVRFPAPILALELARIAPANTNVGRTDLESDPRGAALWVVGQAVAALEKGHGPHPILGSRASAFAAMLGG